MLKIQKCVPSTFSLFLILHQQHVIKIKKNCPRFLSMNTTPVNNEQKLVHPTATGLKLNAEYRKVPRWDPYYSYIHKQLIYYHRKV